MDLLKTENFPDQIVSILAAKIIRSDIRPGERIIEEKIAKELGVSRIPVRDAMKTLEKQGLIEIFPRRYAQVTELTEEFIESTVEVVIELLTLAAQKAAEKGSAEDFELIKKTIKKAEQYAIEKEIQKYFDSILELTIISIKAAKNKILEKIITDLWANVQRIQLLAFSNNPEALQTHVNYLKRAYAYLAKGDVDAVGVEIRNLIENEKKLACASSKKHIAKKA